MDKLCEEMKKRVINEVFKYGQEFFNLDFVLIKKLVLSDKIYVVICRICYLYMICNRIQVWIINLFVCQYFYQ